MTAPEFSRLERLDAIGATERSVTIAADAGERAALARRFGLPGIARLEATFAVRREAAGVRALGLVSAEVTQACIATGEPLAASVAEPVDLRFVPADAVSGEEIELSEADLDVIPFTGGAIDLGEAAAETLALALDPFPRSSDADAALKTAGVLGEDEAGPFGALAGLRDKLKD